MPRVTFMPDDVAVSVRSGENLLRAAMIADVSVTASCGGDGTCGKCRVVIGQGAVSAAPSAKLSDEQVTQGYVLACKTSVTDDVVVRIPPESRPGAVPTHEGLRRPRNTVLSAEDCAARLPKKGRVPPVGKRFLTLVRPDLQDATSDLSRVRHEMRRTHGIDLFTIGLSTLTALPMVARLDDWRITATVVQPYGVTPWVAGFEPGDTTDRQYAIAVDVGTTTVEAEIVDLSDMSVLGLASALNGQVGRGEDVISRVMFAATQDGLAELQGLVRRTINELVERLLERADVRVDEVVAYTLAGNTVMTHLLYGLTPKHIRSSPYVPAASAFPIVRAEELGLAGGPATHVVSMPCPASWLGGDVISGLMAAGVPWSDRLTLFIDVGTNGEIVLGNRDWLVACSCSAGPAFEGGGILHGMRAAEGAIEQVRIDSETFEPMILTIGEMKPLGICGSGLMDCVSELFLVGAIGRNGKFAEASGTPWVREGLRGPEYLLVAGENSATGADIVITEVDIDNLMRAKAAIYAGIDILLETVEIDYDQIDEVVIAGGFGHYLDLERVMAMGMVPEIPHSKFVFIGNGSLLGARATATSQDLLKTAYEIAHMITYVELSVNAGFMDSYMSAMFFPHTDLTLFPETESLLLERSRWKKVQ
jgi:uncharacterized 2Fe-2S/4Fe-4S cluster protein (DUF4445 family)